MILIPKEILENGHNLYARTLNHRGTRKDPKSSHVKGSFSMYNVQRNEAPNLHTVFLAKSEDMPGHDSHGRSSSRPLARSSELKTISEILYKPSSRTVESTVSDEPVALLSTEAHVAH